MTIAAAATTIIGSANTTTVIPVTAIMDAAAAYSTFSTDCPARITGMTIGTCANCSRPMRAAFEGGMSFEQCPQCGGAWFEQDRFEAMLTTSEQGARFARRNPHGEYPERRNIEAHKLNTTLKVGAAAAAVLAIVVGLAGYFIVWPVFTRIATNDNIDRIGTELGKQGKAAASSDAGAWAQKTAIKAAEDRLRNAIGLPPAGGKDSEGQAAAGEAKETSDERE